MNQKEDLVEKYKKREVRSREKYLALCDYCTLSIDDTIYLKDGKLYHYRCLKKKLKSEKIKGATINRLKKIFLG